MIEINGKGEYALWDKGKLIGYAKMTRINNCLVKADLAPVIDKMIKDAFKAGLRLTLNSGYRPFSEQVTLRKKNVIDKSKVNDTNYILTASSGLFSPATAKPGWSNHSDGTAYDFSVIDPRVYAWLVKNAINYKLIRAVSSERWHWEYMPNETNMFKVVPKTHPTWDNLV